MSLKVHSKLRKERSSRVFCLHSAQRISLCFSAHESATTFIVSRITITERLAGKWLVSYLTLRIFKCFPERKMICLMLALMRGQISFSSLKLEAAQNTSRISREMSRNIWMKGVSDDPGNLIKRKLYFFQWMLVVCKDYLRCFGHMFLQTLWDFCVWLTFCVRISINFYTERKGVLFTVCVQVVLMLWRNVELNSRPLNV